MFNLFRKPTADMWLLAGLGNPGGEYKNNRHNIGFMAIDAIAAAHGFPPFKSKHQGQLSEGAIAGEKVVLLKPQTYMNNSGQSVVPVAKFYKIDPARIIVFHDELDVDPNRIRVKLGGGNAGHNGLKSIQAHLGTPNFWRVRMGIGRPQEKDQVSNYVLNDFAKSEQGWLSDKLKLVADHVDLAVKNEMTPFAAKIS